MTAAADAREHAIAAADTTCPRCGAARAPDQAYCLECGLALPSQRGRLPELRRRWVRRFGWYPGDWIWPSLLTLVVAILGAAAAIAITDHRRGSDRPVVTALANVPVAEPAVPAATTRASTATLPTAPEPTVPARVGNGRFAWPANHNGWTIVLVSYPKTTGRAAALQIARKAAKSGLPQAGVLDSSRYASLQPGYFVVFSGIYATQTEANASVATVHQAGFGGAYSRQIAR